MTFRTAVSEFPNDNSELHDGAVWRCLTLTGLARAVVRPLIEASGTVERAVVEPVHARLVESAVVEPSPAPRADNAAVELIHAPHADNAAVELIHAPQVESNEVVEQAATVFAESFEAAAARHVMTDEAAPLVLADEAAPLEVADEVAPLALADEAAPLVVAEEVEELVEAISDLELAAVIEASVDDLAIEASLVEELIDDVAIEAAEEPVAEAEAEAGAEPEHTDFDSLLQVLEEIALKRGATRVAAVIKPLLTAGRVGEELLSASSVESARRAGFVTVSRGSVQLSDGVAATLAAWRGALDGSGDLSGIGDSTLDGFCAEIMASLIAEPSAGGDLRRQLRSRGVAAFGLLELAA
ncbi:MAG: hypothetical protein R3B13_19365 [Polyangiaceae bacterium]